MPGYVEKTRFNELGELEVSSDVAASIFGISQKMLSKWAQRGCPKSERGWWNVKAIVEWRGLSREGDTRDSQSMEAKKMEAEADYKHAKARQEELRLLELMGELVPRDMVRQEMSEVFTGIRQTLLNIPVRLRTELHTSYPDICMEVGRIAEDDIRKCLAGLSGANNASPIKGVAKKSSRKRKGST